jgi:predicted heme/steroid binding protein
MEQQLFTPEGLSQFDGRDGRKAYVAYQGKVYDVTDSLGWKDGDHGSEHQAGADLTAAMDGAPHFPDELDAFPVVGTLAE